MPRTIQCQKCGVKLNLPAEAVGRKVKCPKCGEKFQFVDPAPGPTNGSPPKATPPPPDRSAESTFVLSKSSSSVEIPLPTASGDLRETFDLPLMTEAAGSFSGPGAGGGGKGRGSADALALFDEPAPRPRKKTGAEARASARRCTCGGVVPIGMSICPRCGLDHDTGARVDLMEDLAPPAPPRSAGLPIAMTVVGALCAATGLGLGLVALYKSITVDKAWLCLAIVAGFGVYSAVQFLRAKSVKPLLMSLTMGAFINVATLIFLPIYNYNAAEPLSFGVDVGEDTDATGIAIVQAPLDMDTLKIGITVLVLYAAVCIYLLSPQVARQLRK